MRKGFWNSMEVPQKILSDITIHMKYARFLPEKNRRETWEELCKRNMNMHIDKFPELKNEIEQVYSDYVIPKKVLPSMRSLQFAGKPISINPTRQYNCSALAITSPEAFAEVMFLLLGGTGVGFSVQKNHVKQLPPIQGIIKPVGRQRKQRYLVGDSIEGWSDAIKVLVNSYFHGKKELDFDLSDIRPKGSRLVVAGGRAPGPSPLRKCIAEIISVFENALAERGRGTQLKPIECHDICCYIADAVLAGGIRRSATISLFSKDDIEMLYCKSGRWWESNLQRARANNSAVFIRAATRKKDFMEFWEIIKNSGSGEPGIFFTNDPNMLINPCQPKWATVLTPNGISTIENIKAGDKIWSEDGWVTVSKKWSTGIKDVYRYRTNSGVFYGTENHRVVSAGEKIEVSSADSIDRLAGEYTSSLVIDPQDVMDGLIIGDGTVHKASNNLVYLLIGGKDQDYLNSEISHLITKSRPGIGHGAYEVSTTINYKEMDYKPVITIPDRFVYGSKNKVAGFLRGLFTANGSICGQRVCLAGTSKKLIEQAQIMLSSLGINSYITKNKGQLIQFSNGAYQTKPSYDINITSDREKFYSIIGFIQGYKNDALSNLVNVVKDCNRQKNTFDIYEVDLVSTEEVFDITVDGVSHTYWTGGCNVSNCAEVSLKNMSFCNLTEINANNVESQEDLNGRVRAATILGTIQASYTDFHYLREEWRENAETEALLGVSMTGIASNAIKELDLELAANIAQQTNKEWAEKVGIRPSKRITTGKPSGTTSCVLGCSSGVHAWHAKFYIRRIRVNKDEAIYHYLLKNHPEILEDDVTAPHLTAIITLPQKAPDNAITREDESPIDLLERVKHIHSKWIVPGHNDGANTHNQSVTVSIRDNEWDEVGKWMWENRSIYNGISVLPYDGGTYVQAPFEEITEGRYLKLLKTLHEIDVTKILEVEDNTDLQGEAACAGGACVLV